LIWIESLFNVIFNKEINPKGILGLLTKICSFEKESYYLPGVTQHEDLLRDMYI